MGTPSDKRRMQNLLAQRRYRLRMKEKKEMMRQNSSQPPSESNSAMDLSIPEQPSARLEIEVLHRQLERIGERYTELVAQNREEPSVVQFVTENWQSLKTLFEKFGTITGQSFWMRTSEDNIPTHQRYEVMQQLPFYADPCTSQTQSFQTLTTPDPSIIQRLTEQLHKMTATHSRKLEDLTKDQAGPVVEIAHFESNMTSAHCEA